MDNSEIINRFIDAELNVHPDTLSALLALEDPSGLVEEVIASVRSLPDCPAVITPDFLATLDKEKQGSAPAVEIRRPRKRTTAEEHSSELKIRKDKDVTGKSFSEGNIEGFFRFFNKRYEGLSSILKRRDQIRDATPIDYIKGKSGEEVKVIGMVSDIRITKNGHCLVIIEDPTGQAPALIPQSDRALMGLSRELVKDEVLGIIGKMSRNGDLLIINDILFPDLPVARKQNRSPDPVAVALISDMHTGSKMFVEDAFGKFIKWIEGDLGTTKQRDLAGDVKYVIVGGDLVDGVGIYPEQKNELNIKNISLQYEKIADYIEQIPPHIEIIILPGNHDAARQAEPQPAILEEFVPSFYEDSRIHMVGNPCFATIKGVDIVSYHGRGLDDVISTIPEQSYSKPEEAMLYTLKKRHLAPIYGGKVPFSPEEKDYLILDEPPDIFHSGHTHTFGIKNYRGTTIINSGTFQRQTSFQRKNNVNPDVAEVPIINLHEQINGYMKTTLMRFL